MDHYRPPKSSLGIHGQQLRSPWIAVGAGLGTYVAGTELVIHALRALAALGWTLPLFLPLVFAVTVLSGVVCARNLRARDYLLGGVLAALLTLVGVAKAELGGKLNWSDDVVTLFFHGALSLVGVLLGTRWCGSLTNAGERKLPPNSN